MGPGFCTVTGSKSWCGGLIKECTKRVKLYLWIHGNSRDAFTSAITSRPNVIKYLYSLRRIIKTYPASGATAHSTMVRFQLRPRSVEIESSRDVYTRARRVGLCVARRAVNVHNARRTLGPLFKHSSTTAFMTVSRSYANEFTADYRI